MPIPSLGHGRRPPTSARPSTLDYRPAFLRAALLVGCAVSVALAAWLAQPSAHVQADADLAFLLRGMAVIKAGIVLVAVFALLWRFRQPVATGIAASYLLVSWLAAGSAMLVWQLSSIAVAAAVFHVAELGGLLVAWIEHRAVSGPRLPVGRAASALPDDEAMKMKRRLARMPSTAVQE